MIVRIFTESGSVYDIVDGMLRRTPADVELSKRRDGEWLKLLGMIPGEPVVGLPVSFVLEPLDEAADYTSRMATRVVRIELEGE